MREQFWAVFFLDLLVPAVMIVAGLLMWKRPPKKINPLIGFRTELSMRSERNWRAANVLCGRLWWLVGWIALGVSALAQLFFLGASESELVVLCLVVTLAQTAVLCLTIIPVQRRLEKLQ